MGYRPFNEDEKEQLKTILREQVGDEIVDSIPCDFIPVHQMRFITFLVEDGTLKSNTMELQQCDVRCMKRGKSGDVMLIYFDVNTQSFVQEARMSDSDLSRFRNLGIAPIFEGRRASFARMKVITKKQAQQYGIL